MLQSHSSSLPWTHSSAPSYNQLVYFILVFSPFLALAVPFLLAIFELENFLFYRMTVLQTLIVYMCSLVCLLHYNQQFTHDKLCFPQVIYKIDCENKNGLYKCHETIREESIHYEKFFSILSVSRYKVLLFCVFNFISHITINERYTLIIIILIMKLKHFSIQLNLQQ